MGRDRDWGGRSRETPENSERRGEDWGGGGCDMTWGTQSRTQVPRLQAYHPTCAPSIQKNTQ